MTRNLLLSFVLTVALTAGVSPLWAAVSPGDAAPDFTLTDTRGTQHQLSNHKGSFVVLEWTNYDCPFVRKHYSSGNMQSLQEKYAAQGVVWFSVSTSAPGKQGHYLPERWNELIAEKGAKPSALLLDTTGEVGKSYGATATPHMFIVNPEGVVIYQGAIDDTPTADPADIPASTNYVSAALDRALQGQEPETPSTQPYGCSVKY
ncbi:MAG: thioredoxin family protein [Candidatus Omnitrophica bacterium]|nr:thioredoxin family protein [Candidatus Omnitrophota bacterium]